MTTTLYPKILFATDLGPQSLYIGQRVNLLCQIHQASLCVLHVIEPPLTYTAQFSVRDKLLNEAKEAAQKSLTAFCQELNLAGAQQMIQIGVPKDEILAVSQQQQCRLMVLGSHGVGGYTHLLGSTAHYVMKESFQDVLIIQVSHLREELEKFIPHQGKYLWQVPSGVKKAFISLHQSPPFSGSKKGFGSEVKRGPRLSMRPAGSPYKGGTRSNEDEGEH